MNLPEKQWTELYAFALKYAYVCRSRWLEVHELVNEMMLALMQAKEWRSEEYAKQLMRNHVMDLFRHHSVIRKWECPLEEGDQVYRIEDEKWDARLMVSSLLSHSSKSQARTYQSLLQGNTIQETMRDTHLHRSSIHRHLSQAKVYLSR